MENNEFDRKLKELIPEAESYIKDTGCMKCDVMPNNEICLDCQLEQADEDVVRAMRIREELEKKKEKESKEQEHAKL
jgi:hypothetical protein